MDNFRDTINNVTHKVFKTSKSIYKSTKLSMELSNQESKLKSIYMDIGKKVHEIYSYGGSLGKFFDEKFKELQECEQGIDSLRKELDDAKGSRSCPKCGKSTPITAGFCPKCGAKLGETPENAAMLPPGSQVGIVQSQEAFGSNVNPGPGRTELAPVPEPVPVPMPEPEPEPAPVPAAAAVKRCPLCGKDNARDDKFCISCGRIL